MEMTTLVSIRCIVVGSLLVWCDAFALPFSSLHPPSSNNALGRGYNNNNGGGRKTPGTSMFRFCDDDDDDDEETNDGDITPLQLSILGWILFDSDDEPCDSSNDDKVKPYDNNQEFSQDILTSTLRGGASSTQTKSIGKSSNDSIISKIRAANPFQGKTITSNKSTEQRKQQKLLSSTIVQSVSAPNSALLNPDDITQCAKETNLIGGNLTPETLEQTATLINRLYMKHGYVMNCVTGATLVPPSDATTDDHGGHVELKVKEVTLARPKNRNSSLVNVRFVEKMDQEDMEDKENIITLPVQSSSDQSQSGHQSYRIVSGRTRPSKIARSLGLVSGSHFQILPELWSRLVVSSSNDKNPQQQHTPVFSAIHAVRPLITGQDTVELEIVATENKPFVSLEYGVTKSLYSDQWEGELDVKHANLFGGGEVATINIRKGMSSRQKNGSVFKNWKNEISSFNWRASMKDDYLGSSDSGYDVTIIRDHVGLGALGDVIDEIKEEETVVSPLRTGVTMKLRLPHSTKYSLSLPKALSARFEYIDPFTKNDCAQCMTSMSADIGPYRNTWNESIRPVRSSISAIAAAGRKWNIDGKSEKDNNDDASRLPYYATGTITSQQIMPLSNEQESFPPIDLAIRNVASASTRYLPRHEAIMLGLTSRIRGYKYNYQQDPVRVQQQDTEEGAEKNVFHGLKNLMQGKSNNQFRPPVALTKAISGTVEVRIPFERLIYHPIIGRGNVVLFGDWCVSHAQAQPSLMLQHTGGKEGDFSVEPIRHSSLGIGLRKVVQGIPLKVDACLTEHGTKGVFFGIGNN